MSFPIIKLNSLDCFDRSPRKSPRERKSQQTNEVNGTSNTGIASSENDE
jgi:hypothetical protein